MVGSPLVLSWLSWGGAFAATSPAVVGLAAAGGELGGAMIGASVGSAVVQRRCAAEVPTERSDWCRADYDATAAGALSGALVGAGVAAVGASLAVDRRPVPALLGGAVGLCAGLVLLAGDAVVDGSVENTGGLWLGLLALPIGCGIGSALGGERLVAVRPLHGAAGVEVAAAW